MFTLLPLRRACTLVLAAALCLGANAQERPVPVPSQLLTDETGVLDEEAARELRQRLQALQDSGRAQVAVLLVPDPGAEPLADFALRVAQQWQLGRAGRDDGLLVLLVPSVPAARIEVGYGLEGSIPDVQALRWIDELLPAMKRGEYADGLHHLLDQIESTVPEAAPPAGAEHLLDRHPEWKLPFVIAVFSPFALFPLFMGRWGAVASAPLLAAALGHAAAQLWGWGAPALAVALLAFLLPPLWSLNHTDEGALPPWLRSARRVGNAAAVVLMFAWLELFIGVGLSELPEARWGGPLFAGTMALGLACVLLPGRPAQVMLVVLRSVMHFLFVLALAYPALMELVPDAAPLAFAFAGAFTALVGLALFADAREKRALATGAAVTRWSPWLIALALLTVLPLALLMLVQGLLGPDFEAQLVRAAAGGGSIAGVLWWAARHGLFAALRVGLGGRFGGGGAEGRG